MNTLLYLCLAIATATASVVPPYGWSEPGWGDYGVHHHHHVPVATSYASVWKIDHSVPVVLKPVAPWWGPDPAWDPHAAWGHPHTHDIPEPYGPHY